MPRSWWWRRPRRRNWRRTRSTSTAWRRKPAAASCGARPDARSGSLAAAGAARARGAAEAMARGDDAAALPGRLVEVADGRPPGPGGFQVEHLVEVAVVQAPVPAHRQRVAAHEAVDRRRVVGIHQALHVGLEVAR